MSATRLVSSSLSKLRDRRGHLPQDRVAHPQYRLHGHEGQLPARPRRDRPCAPALEVDSCAHGRLFIFEDGAAQLAQFGFDDSRIGRPHADQKLLPCGTRLQIAVLVLEEHPRLDEFNRPLHVGRLQHVVDHFNQAIIEILRRVTEILVGLLEERIEVEINARQLFGIRGTQRLHERRIALVVVGAQSTRASSVPPVTVLPE